ncbi:hypothetical protein [Streptomyces sp. TLI_171]|uniref:hypothetical protein n=1 Tax=Streptomyces sp. TLI_171 TaxID=1938859 RepID=UPI000C19C28D|nr:hypothetical protein [Streptomyces sp. TLI_171]RKE21778.1 hypothetical protein BX266_5178 [Streptomyces sp. TLI_171]
MDVLLAANALAALASAGSSVVGVCRPGLGLPAGEPVTLGTHVYVRAYAGRALPLGAATAVAAVAGGAAVAWPLLLVSGLAQVADSAIGFRQRNLGMAFGAGAFAVLHLLSALAVAR